MCSVGRKIYQCIKRTRRYNTWVEEHDGTTSEYWVKIYESPYKTPDRNKIVSFTNRAPLGGSTIWVEIQENNNTTIHLVVFIQMVTFMAQW